MKKGSQALKAHVIRRGIYRGVKNGNSKLTEDDVRMIRLWCRTGVHFQYTVAQKYGISQSQVGRIIQGLHWSHIV